MESIGAAIVRMLGSPGFKFFLICGLILVLTIPLLLVWAVIEDRERRADGVMKDVAREWGGAQDITGPVLIVPYTTRHVRGEGDKRVEEIVEHRAVFLPQTLDVNGSTRNEVRRRSIYDVAVYTATLDFKGRFAAPDVAELATDIDSVRWRDAILALGIGDVSGLTSTASIAINGGGKLAFEPSIGVPGNYTNGIHARLGDAGELFGGNDAAGPGAIPRAAEATLKGFDFAFALTLNGSQELKFAPVARETTVSLASDWPDPGFTGAFLPTERKIDATSFAARWQVPHLARSVPQAWVLGGNNLNQLDPYEFGVRFIVPVDFYQVVARAAKYALMFLATAFMAVFVMELRSAHAVHPVQYMFVGIAMVIFYILLLSLAEQTGFLVSYLVAAVATTGLIAAYVGAVQRSFVKGIAMALVLALLYGLLYMILQLEDYALLWGAVAGFLMLAGVMFATARVDWSGEAEKKTQAS